MNLCPNPLSKQDQGDVAVGLFASPLAQPQAALSSEAELAPQEADSAWLAFAADVFAGEDEAMSLIRESAPSPTLPGKAETPASATVSENALGKSPQVDLQAGEREDTAVLADAGPAMSKAGPAQHEPEEQVEQDPFAGYYAEVGELFDFAYRYYNKLMKTGEKAPPVQQPKDEQDAIASANSLANDARATPLKMFERSLALRHKSGR